MSVFKQLKTMLLLTVALLVIITGILLSQILIQNYSANLMAQATARAESIAHKLSLDVADKMLINDLVSVQKILDDQLKSEPAVSYLFILSNGQVPVHTFQEGIPVRLIGVNAEGELEKENTIKIVSEKNERYIDTRWPIFNAKAGVLRLGLSEAPFQQKINRFGLRMTLISLAVLGILLLLGHFLITRLIRPLVTLTESVAMMGKDNLEARLEVRGPVEIEKLVVAYNGMMARISEHTTRLRETNQTLEQRNTDLDRAHGRLVTVFSVSRNVAALADLKAISAFLVKTLENIVKCGNPAMVILDHEKRIPFLAAGNNFITLEAKDYDLFYPQADQQKIPCFVKPDDIKTLPLPNGFKTSYRIAVFPFRHHGQMLGAILIACPHDCVCIKAEMEVIHLILEQASGAVFRALEYEKEIMGLRHRVDTVEGFRGMVGKDPKIQVIYKLIEDVAPTDATILIQGESGTGKEMVAKAIHDLSHRSDKPFVVINCSAYPATLLESELFGHEKGAFTGALSRKTGRFEQATGGTVFLDEIGEISPSAQTMLLRVLQSQKIERIGGDQSIRVDTRVLAATNRNLLDEVKKGAFREDLFYRLNVIPINLPPLCNRKNDIPALASFFLKKFSGEQRKTIDRIDPEAMRVLMDYIWPGNIRELENCIEYSVTLSKFNRIFVSDLPGHLSDALKNKTDMTPRVLTANEETIIRKVFEESGWNKTVAASNLGISRSTLYEKLKKYNIISPGRQGKTR
ncbi:MAG: sigma 54-interacting transcriptional regulator [Desulfobacula sp.]|jgi:two-component system response regulator HydG